jgi:predicted metal-dependent HD superfamily phosphohydrolase
MDRRRFEQLWRDCADSIDSDWLGACYEEVHARYTESHRRYHSAGHIAHCLQQFDAASGLLDDANAVELAVWYHDVVYDIGAIDNEARSAEMFLRHASGQLSEDMSATVHELIMVTMHLCSLPATSDQSYLVDIDLSSFGLPRERFLRDSVNVREEFPHIPDAEFYTKQKKFLLELLGRKHFFFTEFFRNRHEVAACENISAYVQKLTDTDLLSSSS